MESYAVFFSIVYIVTSGQGIFLAFILFNPNRKARKKNNYILGVLVFLLSLQLCFYGLAYSKLALYYPHLWGATGSFTFLYGPLIYLYILFRLNKFPRKFTWYHLLHFLPFLVYLCFRMDFYLLDAESKRTIIVSSFYASKVYKMSTTNLLFSIVGIIQLLIYLVLGMRLLKDVQSNEDFNQQAQSYDINWLRKIIIAYSGYVLFFTFYKWIQYLQFEFGGLICHLTKLGMAASLYNIGYLAILKPEILTDFYRNVKYKNTRLPVEAINILAQKIDLLMKKEQPYLREDFNLAKLSDLLDTPNHYISQAINEYFNVSFSKYTNQYRIEHAKQLLIEEPDKKILAIAFESGYANKVTFNVAFKKFTGMPPSEFRKKIKKEL